MIFRPLRALEAAATTIGLTSKQHVIKERGTEDVQRLTRAINDMQARIKSVLAERSQTLASLAHDIRTGLTHIKLRLDDLNDETAAPFESDVEHLEHLFSDMLLYFRAEQPGSDLDLVDVSEFARQIVADLPMAIDTKIALAPFLVATEPAALKRAFSNIISNSIRYAGSVEISSERTDQGLEVFIED